MEKGLVSVITPCYNGESYVKNLLDSLLKQTYKSLEFIFVDDGSTDRTKEVVKSYEEKFKKAKISFKYLYQKNGGQASAINNGLKFIKGEYLVWPDSDDYYENDAIESMVKFLDKQQKYNAVRGEAACRKNNKKKEIVEIRKSCDPKNNDLFLNYIIEKDTYYFPGIIMIRTDNFFKNNKGREIYNNRAGQNWQLILPAVYNSKTGYLNKVVYNVLEREDSHSRKKVEGFKVLRRMHNHRKILNKTVKRVVDDPEERKKYLKIIKDKYDEREKEFIKYKLKHWREN